MQPQTDQAFFEEEQSFRQTWLWVLLAGILAILITALITVAQGPAHPKGQSALLGLSIATVVLGGVILLMFFLKLTVTVDAEALRIKFFPLANKTIPLDQIARWEARTYRPLLEYGGWGIRYSRHGTAYNVSGTEGVQLELADGKRLLIGSQRFEELADAIGQAKQAVR